jgi:tetratricopeptide (TPR) repeat protein
MIGTPAPWHDWLICEMFCREAEALIPEGTVPGEDATPGSPERVNYPRINSLIEAGRLDDAITILRQAVSRKPDDAKAQRILGDLLAQRGRWEQASKVLDKAAELDPSDDMLALQVATLHLYLADDAGYQRTILSMLDRFGKTENDAQARSTKSCLLSPSPGKVGRSLEIARRNYERSRDSNPNAEHHGWAQLDWALAEYRGGHFEQAADHLKKCRAAGGVLGLEAEAILAMTYQRLGLKGEAGRLLSTCRTALREVAGRASGSGSGWQDYLMCELFCREAEALIRNDAARPSERKASDLPGPDAKLLTPPASRNKP